MQGDRRMYRLGFGLAAVAEFMLVWMGLGVGIIGRDGDPATCEPLSRCGTRETFAMSVNLEPSVCSPGSDGASFGRRRSQKAARPAFTHRFWCVALTATA